MKPHTVAGRLLALTLAIGLLAAGAMAAEQSVTGTVDQNDSGKIIILADDGEAYLVKGMDLSNMIGKTVKATGALDEAGDSKSVTVLKLEEIED